MKGKFLLIILGVAIIVLNQKKIMLFHWGWPVFCFALWFILFYIDTRKKNVERRTIKPVYMVNK